MPNFHPDLVAAVRPFLGPSEEVWAVYPSSRRSLVVTGSRMFVLGRETPEVHGLEEFIAMRRPTERLVLLERRAGMAIALHIDPHDEHGIQALTVIGLLFAIASKANGRPLSGPPRAQAAPHGRVLPTMRCRHVVRATAGSRLARRAVCHVGAARRRAGGREPAELVPGAC